MNKYFNTQLYRQCTKCRENRTEKILNNSFHKAIVISFLVGVVDMLLIAIVNQFVNSMWLRIIICILLGAFCGWQLGLLHRRLFNKNYSRLKNAYFDIELLTDRIEDIQYALDKAEGKEEEDYELVGDKRC